MINDRPSRIKNLSIVGISALAGCVPLVLILGALFLGLWLDSLIGQRGLATVSLLIISAPISLFLMTSMALALVRRIQPKHIDTLSQVDEEEVFLEEE